MVANPRPGGRPKTAATTHKTALVLVPPTPVWEPIQAIRRVHDRQLRRWMPHITLLYPFVPAEAFAAVAPRLAAACAELAPFQVELREFSFFRHATNRYTLWLRPEAGPALHRLQAALARAVPEAMARSGFVPHLSVGQVHRKAGLQETLQRLQAEWQPLSFVADAVSLIRREEPPDDVFAVERVFELGGKPHALA